MNIFYLDSDPETCAKWHNDKHTVKMILESHQLLCTAHRVLDGDDYADSFGFYKATHKNHPSAKWVRESVANYRWLHDLLTALHDEYTYRYGKIHKSKRLLEPLLIHPKNIPTDTPFTQPPQAMPYYCKRVDSIEAYRVYYMTEKLHLASWKNRDVPPWFTVLNNDGGE